MLAGHPSCEEGWRKRAIRQGEMIAHGVEIALVHQPLQ